jgi:hypothetical protein
MNFLKKPKKISSQLGSREKLREEKIKIKNVYCAELLKMILLNILLASVFRNAKRWKRVNEKESE